MYKFCCEDCEIFWEVEGTMSKPPKKRKCPECGKMRDRVFTVTNIHFKGFGWETNQSKAKKRFEQGMDKDSAQQFYKNAMNGLKEDGKTAGDVYTPMTCTRPEELGRKMTDSETKVANEKRAKISKGTGMNKAVIDKSRKK